MVKITESCFEATGHTSVICDFSPPRSGDQGVVDQAQIGADFISVAYNPGRAVRTNSVMLAAAIQNSGNDAVFTLATRDMNKLALQSQLLGAQLLSVQNVVVVQGDPFGEHDQKRVASVNDYSSTGLIAAIADMNQGQDFKWSKLGQPTDFCIGAAVDLGRGIEEEAQLAVRKVQAGAEFLITQPIFNVDHVARYRESFGYHAGKAGTVPTTSDFRYWKMTECYSVPSPNRCGLNWKPAALGWTSPWSSTESSKKAASTTSTSCPPSNAGAPAITKQPKSFWEKSRESSGPTAVPAKAGNQD